MPREEACALGREDLRHNQDPPSDKDSDARNVEQMFDFCEPPLTLGSCVLRDKKIAETVQMALLCFEGERYKLSAWCIMPNHVHVVVTPLEENKLFAIVHSWKSFTSNKINKALRRKGVLWERESFDHLIRTPAHFEGFITYTEENPVKAGLCKHPQDWSFSSCGASFQMASVEFVDPYKAPFVQPHSRGKLPHLEKPGGSYFVTFRLADAVQPG